MRTRKYTEKFEDDDVLCERDGEQTLEDIKKLDARKADKYKVAELVAKFADDSRAEIPFGVKTDGPNPEDKGWIRIDTNGLVQGDLDDVENAGYKIQSITSTEDADRTDKPFTVALVPDHGQNRIYSNRRFEIR